MIDVILSRAAESDYDFRRFANPDDPLAHLFEDWVPNYRMKRARPSAARPARASRIRFTRRSPTSRESNLHATFSIWVAGAARSQPIWPGAERG